MASTQKVRRGAVGGWVWVGVVVLLIIAVVGVWKLLQDQGPIAPGSTAAGGSRAGSGPGSTAPTPFLGTVQLGDAELRQPAAIAAIVDWPVELREAMVCDVVDDRAFWV